MDFVFEFSFTYWLAVGFVFALLTTGVLINELLSENKISAYLDELYVKRTGSARWRILIKVVYIALIALLWKPVAIVFVIVFGLCVGLVLAVLAWDWIFGKKTSFKLKPATLPKHVKPLQ